jgi:hypothetical protein
MATSALLAEILPDAVDGKLQSKPYCVNCLTAPPPGLESWAQDSNADSVLLELTAAPLSQISMA